MLVAHLRTGTSGSVELVLAAKQGVYEHGCVVPSQLRSLDVCRAVVIDHEGKLLSCRKITRFARGDSSRDHHRRWTSVCHRTD